MKETNSYLLQEVKSEVTALCIELNKILEIDIRVSENIEKACGWLFFMAVAGGLTAIFSEFWIAMVSLAFALAACFLLIYKSKTKLMNRIDVNFWFLERAMKLSGKCASVELNEGIITATDEMSAAVINCKQDLITLKDDLEAVRNDVLTASIIKFYNEQEMRGRYTAAIKNKYNRHGIKEPL
ncbi:hypothetical protein [Pedobacter westerhofensis]|nr:hypothetical protein [Pedobacter westerhofensis]